MINQFLISNESLNALPSRLSQPGTPSGKDTAGALVDSIIALFIRGTVRERGMSISMLST